MPVHIVARVRWKGKEGEFYLVRRRIYGRYFWVLYPVSVLGPVDQLVNENFEMQERYASRLKGGVGISPYLIGKAVEVVEVYRPDLLRKYY